MTLVLPKFKSSYYQISVILHLQDEVEHEKVFSKYLHMFYLELEISKLFYETPALTNEFKGISKAREKKLRILQQL